MIERINLAKEAAQIAGAIIKSASPQEGSTQKEGRLNFVTAADLASEKAIIEHIRRVFPNDAILSEETHSELENPLQADHLWVIDPIDGTNNFRRQRDYSGISIGYVEKGEMLAGVIYNPFRDEIFTTEKDKGAYLNGKRISVAYETDITRTEIATDTWYESFGTRQNMETVLKLKSIPFILMKGSAVLALAEVACGRLDLYFHNFLKPWDNAAGFLLVREAGGVVIDFNGEDVSFISPQAICGNKTIVSQFLDEVR